jgi:hypothetical protein
MSADKFFQVVDRIQMKMEANTLAGIKGEALSVCIHTIIIIIYPVDQNTLI